MKLERGYFSVRSLAFGRATTLADGVLTVNRDELVKLVRSEDTGGHIADLDLEMVCPGEDARIVHVLDTLPVGVKVSGEGDFLPGHLAPPTIVGSGVTHLFENFVVMECAELPWAGKSALLYARDAIIDMVGPAAGYSPFSQTFNLVLRMTMKPGASDVEYDEAVRHAGIRVARAIGKILEGATPDRIEVFDFDAPVDPKLPRVAYVTQCQTQGTYSNTFLYGKEVSNLVPAAYSPTELMDGCIVSGNYVWPWAKIPTFIQVNMPVVMELARAHGKTVNFVGVVFDRGHNNSHVEKQRVANLAASQVRRLGAQGCVISWEGGGNSATDAMLTLQTLEKWGIRCTSLCYEFGGPDGSEGILLVDDVPEAKYLVSGGSIEKPTRIPKVKRVAGGDCLRLRKETGGDPEPADVERVIENTTPFYCAGNQSGIGKLAGVGY